MAQDDYLLTGLISLGLIITVILLIPTPDMNNDKKKCQLPPSSDAMPVECHESCILTNLEMHHNFMFSQQWQFPLKDEGAFTFDACAPNGGLVVYLTDHPNNKTISDSQGYAIVLNDQSHQNKCYIGKLPNFIMVDPRNSAGQVNTNFKLNSDPSVCQTYWVMHSGGQILVGSGNEAGGNEIICCLNLDEYGPKGIRYFGFGCLRRETTGIRIRDIKIYDAPEVGCDFLSMATKTCALAK